MNKISIKKFALALTICLSTTTAYSMDASSGPNSSAMDVNHEIAKTIPNFSGPIFHKGDQEYSEKIQQYATSSFPKNEMSPFMVTYPKNVQDIAAALAFAKENQKSVVARSGGHQYCGKSSGGQDTIVLSMDNFTTFNRLEDGRVEVGPHVQLTDLAAQFKKWGITIPHGECPLVNIGGHLQTGGFGHLIRSYGLALDYVDAFDIVLADGSFKTVTRPTVTPKTDEERLNQELFRGVLGGNAGSFGIITKYIINPIKDDDHPNSWGFSLVRSYKPLVFQNLMKQVQEWTKTIENNPDDESLKGLDFMMTLESSRGWTLPAVNVVELVYSDPNHGVPYNNQWGCTR